MKTIKLSNVEVSALKSLFARSLTVSTALYFELTPDKIQSYSSNQQDAFCKEWETSLKGIAEHSNDFTSLKFFFIHGAIFSNKILPFFDKAEWVISADDDEVVQEIVMVDKSKGLRFNIKTSNILFANVITKDKQAVRFNTANSVAKFDLGSAVVAAVVSLSDIGEFSEQQIDYVKFTGADGVLSVSNNMFNKEIGVYTGEDFDAKLSKSFLTLIDKEDNTVDLCVEANNSRKFVFSNKNAEITAKSCAALMTDVSLDEEFDINGGDNESW